MDSAQTIIFGVPSLLAVFSHLVFNRHEPSVSTFLGIFSAATLATFFWQYWNGPVYLALYSTFIQGVVYLAVLSASIVCYRLSPFHPLSGFPGPLSYRTSMWVPSLRLWATGKAGIILTDLHNKYGDFVRIGPNHLSIRDAEAMHAVYTNPQFRKDDWYNSIDAIEGYHSLVTISDPTEHAFRRKVWQKVFSMASLAKCLPGMYRRAAHLVSHIEELLAKDSDSDGNGLVDISSLMSYSALDYMGDLAYSGGFELVSDPEMRSQKHLVDRFMRDFGAFSNLPYLLTFLRGIVSLPKSLRDYFDRVQYCVDKAVADGPQAVPNAIQILLASKEAEEIYGHSPQTLMSEGNMITMAGSETVAFTLSAFWWILIQHPLDMQALVEELDEAAKAYGGECPSHDVLLTLPLLNATISEVLRLLPPGTSSGPRRLMPGTSDPQWQRGLMVSGKWIPEGTSIRTPFYPIHRDPRYWGEDANEFRPSRWLNFKTTPMAYVPFSVGPTNCIGKDFALRELRLVCSHLLLKFEIKPVDDFDPTIWLNDLFESVAIVKGPLMVKMRSRGQVGGA